MKQLSTSQFAAARAYLVGRARPLEQSLFRYAFEEGPATAVWHELASFQNSDGGFGHALEPDLRSPSSSALATSVALRILIATDASAEHPLVQEAVDYLRSTLDASTLTWHIAAPDTNDYAHAPWWHDEDGSVARTFDDFQVNPRADLLASLYDYAPLLPPDLLNGLAEATVRAIERLPLGGGGGDDLVAVLRLAQAEGMPQAYRQRVLERARESAPAAVTRDPQQWSIYSTPPLKLAPAPGSPLAGLLQEDVARHLDYLINTQAPEGYWDTTWSWGDFYPDVWPQAQCEWRGEITLHNLRSLRAYGRLAP